MCQSRKVASWFVVGLTASVVEYGLLHGLYEWLGWPLPLATATAAEVLILVKFLVADRWVFGHAVPTAGRLLRYQGACMGALVISLLFTNGLTLLLGAPVIVAFVVGTGVAFVWSLVSNFLWVWAT